MSGARARQLYCASTALLLALENSHTGMVQHNTHTYDTIEEPTLAGHRQRTPRENVCLV